MIIKINITISTIANVMYYCYYHHCYQILLYIIMCYRLIIIIITVVWVAAFWCTFSPQGNPSLIIIIIIIVVVVVVVVIIIIIIIKRRSGINPIPPTVKDRDYPSLLQIFAVFVRCLEPWRHAL